MDKKELRAGAGAAVICFPKDFFAAFPGGAVSWNEPRVRALILDNGQRVCLVSLELASIAGDHIPGLQALVEEVTGIPADHIWIMAARTPSAPELPPVAEMEALPAGQRSALLSWKESIRQAVGQAAKQASASVCPAVLSMGGGEPGGGEAAAQEAAPMGPPVHSLSVIWIRGLDGASIT